MTFALSIFFTLPAALILVVTLFLLAEVLASLVAIRTGPAAVDRPSSIVVVIPAHNESVGMEPTIEDVLSQLECSDRLIVVADNCNDDTASVARRLGAECIERWDLEKRGKGYALQAALDSLEESEPSVVLFVDADCRLSANFVSMVCSKAAFTGRPVQSMNLMKAAEDAPPQSRVSEFAWSFINDVRMRGLYRMFQITRLTGTGMALPWDIAKELEIGTGEIVEDLSLTINLTRKGLAPMILPEALATSGFPDSTDAAIQQHARWEQGSITFAWKHILPMFASGFRSNNGKLIAMAFDLAIPPLTVFGFLMISFLCLCSAISLFGVLMPFYLMSTASVVFFVSLLIGWILVGRSVLPPKYVGQILKYALDKRKVYGREATDSTKTWTRTRRSDASPIRDD